MVPVFVVQQMSMADYEKIYAEKRKALLGNNKEVRVAAADKDFEKMQVVTKTAEEELVLLKLVSTQA